MEMMDKGLNDYAQHPEKKLWFAQHWIIEYPIW